MKTEMKKLPLLFIAFIGLLYISHAQEPLWLNYTYGKEVMALADDGSNIWAGTKGGLAKADKTAGNAVFYNKSNSGLPSNDITALAIEGSGSVWTGTGGGGLAFYDGNGWTVFTEANSGLPGDIVYSVSIDGSGIKWVGTQNGLASFDGTECLQYLQFGAVF